MRLITKFVGIAAGAIALGSCASTSPNMTAEQRAERGAVMVILKNVDNRKMWLSGAAANSDTGEFRKDMNGFFMNIGNLPSGILHMAFSNQIKDVEEKALSATFKNLPAGEYGFVNIYDETRSNCFDERTKIFDVKPGYVNLVTLPASKGFLKKGFFKSEPENPPVNWDYSLNMTESELLHLYETGLKEHFKINMPVRISTFKNASFETDSKPAVSYLCLVSEFKFSTF
ncbi:MAG: hypothetical protein ABJN69_11775 [Hellea sp.]